MTPKEQANIETIRRALVESFPKARKRSVFTIAAVTSFFLTGAAMELFGDWIYDRQPITVAQQITLQAMIMRLATLSDTPRQAIWIRLMKEAGVPASPDLTQHQFSQIVRQLANELVVVGGSNLLAPSPEEKKTAAPAKAIDHSRDRIGLPIAWHM